MAITTREISVQDIIENEIQKQCMEKRLPYKNTKKGSTNCTYKNEETGQFVTTGQTAFSKLTYGEVVKPEDKCIAYIDYIYLEEVKWQEYNGQDEVILLLKTYDYNNPSDSKTLISFKMNVEEYRDQKRVSTIVNELMMRIIAEEN